MLASVFVGVYVFANMIGKEISGMNKEELPRPDEWRPLFEAASVLETAGQFDEEVKLLQRVVRTFGKNDGAWAEAMLRLASLNENELANNEAAKYMLNEIALCVPGTEHARLANERLRSFG